MVCPIKKLFWNAEFAICKFDLPSRIFFKRSFILVIARICNIDNDSISVFKDAPSGNSGTSNIQFYKVRPFFIQIAHIKTRVTTETFKLGTKRHFFSIG